MPFEDGVAAVYDSDANIGEVCAFLDTLIAEFDETYNQVMCLPHGD
ncbi:hypothetical protein [Halorubrum sp. DTA98]